MNIVLVRLSDKTIRTDFWQKAQSVYYEKRECDTRL